MDTASARRYARQIALPEVGPDGQERILRARAVIVGGDAAAEIAALYLAAAGVGAVVRVDAAARDGAGWMDALRGADVVVRSGFDDDAMGGAAARLGAATVVVRGGADLVDLVSTPRRPPAPDAALDVAPRAAARPDDGAAAVLAGALAAAEALQLLAGAPRPAGPTTMRHLRLPLDGRDPLAQEIGAR
jgi:hypothetical protein